MPFRFVFLFSLLISFNASFGQDSIQNSQLIEYKITYSLGKKLTKTGYLFKDKSDHYFFTSRSYFDEDLDQNYYDDAKGEYVINLRSAGDGSEYAYYDYNKGNFYNTRSLGNKIVKTKESYTPLEWKKTKDTIVYKKHPCSIYKSNFRGREYISYVSDSIEFDVGPWKFNGFQGAPLLIKDMKGQLQWEMTKIEKIDSKKIKEYITFIRSKMSSLEEMSIQQFTYIFDRTKGGRTLLRNYPKLPDDFEKVPQNDVFKRTGLELIFEWEEEKE